MGARRASRSSSTTDLESAGFLTVPVPTADDREALLQLRARPTHGPFEEWTFVLLDVRVGSLTPALRTRVDELMEQDRARLAAVSTAAPPLPAQPHRPRQTTNATASGASWRASPGATTGCRRSCSNARHPRSGCCQRPLARSARGSAGCRSCHRGRRGRAGRSGSRAEWRLLLQLDSGDPLGLSFGDVGRIYVLLRAADLAARSWERAWLVLECY